MGKQYFSRRILIIDDNRDAADLVADLLRIHGHITATAYSGRDELKLAKVFAPNFIFVDIGMPGIDGYETAIRMRGMSGGERLCIVALTAWNDSATRTKIIDADFDGHLVKPADLASLLRATQTTRTA